MPCTLHSHNGCSSSLFSQELNEFLEMELFCSAWVVKRVGETWSLHEEGYGLTLLRDDCAMDELVGD